MRTVALSRGGVALVDDEDYDRVAPFIWYALPNGYVFGRAEVDGRTRSIAMHTFIARTPRGRRVDHVNRNRADNQKGNLRIATASQNNLNLDPLSKNASGRRGIYLDRGKYRARIRYERKWYELGRFGTIEEAIAAREVKLR